MVNVAPEAIQNRLKPGLHTFYELRIRPHGGPIANLSVWSPGFSRFFCDPKKLAAGLINAVRASFPLCSVRAKRISAGRPPWEVLLRLRSAAWRIRQISRSAGNRLH